MKPYISTSLKHDKYYVYTLLSLKDFDLYTGFTTDLRRRLQEHIRGLVDSTKIRIPFKLIHYEYFVDLQDAKLREKFLKSRAGRAWLKQVLKKTLTSKTYMPYRLNRQRYK